jgi:hypothetical protein
MEKVETGRSIGNSHCLMAVLSVTTNDNDVYIIIKGRKNLNPYATIQVVKKGQTL